MLIVIAKQIDKCECLIHSLCCMTTQKCAFEMQERQTHTHSLSIAAMDRFKMEIANIVNKNRLRNDD